MDYRKAALDLYSKHKGVLGTISKVALPHRDALSTAYTPGVSEPCREIARDKDLAYLYTGKGNFLAVVTDGSAVLGLGDIGAEAALPVMEGKCILFKTFAGLDAFPLCLSTQDTDEIVQTIAAIAPGFGGINLEDISAPRCFEIERRLQQTLDIPVFHDDQHGTAVVVLAGLLNAAKVRGSVVEELKVVICGVGAAGVAIAKLLMTSGVKHMVVVDSQGIVHGGREGMTGVKREMAELTDEWAFEGGLEDAVRGADVFVGVSKPGVLTGEMVRTMVEDPIVFAMSNPDPEISVEDAKKVGVRLLATGRSDLPNQLNNVLVFPGMMKAAMAKRCQVTDTMKMAAAEALAEMVEMPTAERFIPFALEDGVCEVVMEACMQSF